MHVFVTGATGYMGRPLVERLVDRGHTVRALVRPGSERRLTLAVSYVIGNALDAGSFTNAIRPADTLVHLVGTSNPAPWKAEEFRRVDLASISASVTAAKAAGVRHLIYVSVAHPAPVMRAYIEVREEGEVLIAASGLNATVLRPWYVVGPGHWWPVAFVPVYALLQRVPSTARAAKRLGLVTRSQMLDALVSAVEHPATGVRVLDVPAIRSTHG